MHAELMDVPPAIVIEDKKQLEDLVREVDYGSLETDYMPSDFALKFINFIKMVNGAGGEENKSPLIHMDMLDQLLVSRDNQFVAFRGSAKTSVLHEYLYLYAAVYGGIDGFGDIDVAIYVSDTIDNGVKSMRQQLEYRWNKSDFLQYYLPPEGVKFTDVRWEFTNREGKKLCVRGFGAATGVRGFKEYGQRPTWCGLDDLLSDKNAQSPTIIKDIEDVVYKAVRNALHPAKRMVVWTGTPFNKKDPLYIAAASAGWNTRVYPICEKFPCTREEFKGAWEDRFSYDFVLYEYNKFLNDGKIAAFNQELMLRIVSEEDRLIQDVDVLWFNRESVMRNKSSFNFYITTDFATSEDEANDQSVIMAWAHNSKGDWFLVDIMVEKQLMDKNIDALFQFAQRYKPQQVGVEVSGQQGGFISWIKQQMLDRRIFFNLASHNNKGKEGILPTGNKKIQRFNIVVPWFKAKTMYFPYDIKESREMKEVMEVVTLATMEGFKSANDDCGDCISQLSQLHPWRPSMDLEQKKKKQEDDIWEADDDDDEIIGIQSYIV